MAQMVVRPSSGMALIIVQTSSGSIRNVRSLSNVTRSSATPIFASTVRPIAVPDGIVMVTYGTCESFGSALTLCILFLKGENFPIFADLTARGVSLALIFSSIWRVRGVIHAAENQLANAASGLEADREGSGVVEFQK